MQNESFITLTCPNCGGKRSIQPDSTRVKCEYCGNEFLIDSKTKEGMLESHVACPKCHRNDRVEKVSTILSSQIHKIEGTTVQQQTIRKGRREITQNVNVPYQATQSTALAERFKQPEFIPVPTEPNHPKPFTIEGYIQSGKRKKFFGIALVGIFSLCSIFTAVSSSTSDPSFSPVVNALATLTICLPLSALAGGPFWFLGHRQEKNAGNHEIISRLESESEQRQSDYSIAVNEREKIIKQNITAKGNWEELYYCYRDDCAFVPNSGKWTTLTEIQNYIYRV